jgi:hypothetical protein
VRWSWRIGGALEDALVMFGSGPAPEGSLEMPAALAASRVDDWLGDALIRHTLLEIAARLSFHQAPVDKGAASRDLLRDALRRGALRVFRVRSPHSRSLGPSAPASQPPASAAPPSKQVVNPVITPATLLVVVKKLAANPAGGPPVAYTSPARQALTLTTDAAFDGTGTFTCDTSKVKVFSAATGGTEITFDGTDNVWKPGAPPAWAGGAALPGGVTVFVEGKSASQGMDDITAMLSLKGGSKTNGPDDLSTITAVEVTLDICKSRTDMQLAMGTDADPLSPDDKINLGRFLHVQDTEFNQGRALLIVQKIKPEACKKSLELKASGGGKVALFAADAPPPVVPPAAAPPRVVPLGTQVIPPASLPAKFWAEGAGVSDALVDTGFELGIQGIEPEGDKAKCTVVQFTQIQATIEATPPITDRRAQGFPPPDDHVFTTAGGSEDFTETAPLVLMRSPERDIALALTAAATPPPESLQIVWKAYRNPLDAGAIGGPGETPTLVAAAGDKLKAQLGLDERGAFRIRPFIDCNGSGEYEDREPSLPMNLVLVSAVMSGADRSTSTTVGNAVTVDSARFGIITGSFATAPFTVPQPAGDAIVLNLDADLVGGGSDGTLGVDHVFGGVIQNIDTFDLHGGYRSPSGKAHGVALTPAANPGDGSGTFGFNKVFLPGDPALKPLALPMVDTGWDEAKRGGEYACMSNSMMRRAPSQPVFGRRVEVWSIDSPGLLLPLRHPAHHKAVLESVHLSVHFRSCFSFWTNVGVTWPAGDPAGGIRSKSTGDPAERVYSVIRTVCWQLTGDFTTARPEVASDPLTLAVVDPYKCSITQSESIDPMRRADDRHIEVRATAASPSLLVFDATQAQDTG